MIKVDDGSNDDEDDDDDDGGRWWQMMRMVDNDRWWWWLMISLYLNDKNNMINILQADHVVGLAYIEINIGIEILFLGGHTLPSIIPTPIGNPKFQITQIPILTADLENW